MIFPYDNTKSRWQHKDEVFNFTINRIMRDDPCWLRVHDPDFSIGKLFEPPPDPDAPKWFWPSFIEAVTERTKVEEIYILTTKGVKKYFNDNAKLYGLELRHDQCVNFKYQSHRRVAIRVTHFKNEQSNSSSPRYPLLYDRWIIWGREQMTKGLHFGHFHDDIFCKDMTITEFTGDAPRGVLNRFNEIEGMCE